MATSLSDQQLNQAGFLGNAGELGRRIAAYDWNDSLGPVDSWSISLKTTVGLILHSPVPIVLLWGTDGIMIYNDAYSVFAGNRHPHLLGSKVREGWPEVADFNDNVMNTCLAGGVLTYRDQELALNRSGKTEQVWMNLDYSPVIAENGEAEGVIAVVVETTARVLVERRIEQERAQFVRLFDQAHTFMVLLNGPEHRISFANPGYLKLVGQRPLFGLTIAEALPDAAAQGYVERLDEVFRTGKAFSATAAKFRIESMTGASTNERYLDFVYQPMTGENGDITGIFVEGVDVTDRVVAGRRREALVELTDALRDLTETVEIGFAASRILGEFLGVSRVGYGTINLESDTLYVEQDWNAPGIESLAGSIPLRLYGSFIESLKQGEFVNIANVHEDPRTCSAEAAANLERRNARSFINFPLLEKSSLVAVLFVNHNEIRNWSDDDLAMVREVGERTRIAMARSRGEAALRESEARLRAANEQLEQRVQERTLALQRSEENTRTIFETSHQYQCLLTIEGKVIYANKTSLDGINCQLSDVAGEYFWRTPWFTTTPNMPVLLEDFFKRVVAGETVSTTVALDTLTGRRTFDFSMRPVFDENGAVAAIVPEALDITARVEAEDALRQSQKMEAVGQLTGGLAHDFNNLLTGISGSLEMLRTRVAQGRSEALERYITAAQGAASRAAALTHRLLAFSRRQTLDPRPTDTNKLVTDMEDLIRRSVGTDIQINVALTQNLWPILVDPNQLENALLNLCINARDAMPEGGRITIETSNKWLDERAAKTDDLKPGHFVALTVTDTGSGMSPEIISRAFDPFFTTKPLGEGTGLGLSMIYGFVRQSGGQIRIYSHVGLGTSVHLYLPRDEAAPQADTAPDVPDETSLQSPGEMVLVIDDEPTVRMLITEVLDEFGYTALEAADGQSGLKILQSPTKIDLLITDVGLPGGMNGRQVADAARVLRPDLKILFITGYAETAVIGNRQLAPGMQVLTKPFEMQTLAHRIRSMISDNNRL